MSTGAPDDDRLRRGDVDPKMLTDAGLVAELITEVRSLARSVATFAEALVATDKRVEELADLRRRNRTLGVAITVALAALAVTVASAIVGGALAFSRLTDIAEGNAVNGRVLIECTTPSPPPEQAIDDADKVHECAERSAQAQAGALDTVGTIVLDAAICARSEADPSAIRACYRHLHPVTTTTTMAP